MASLSDADVRGQRRQRDLVAPGNVLAEDVAHGTHLPSGADLRLCELVRVATVRVVCACAGDHGGVRHAGHRRVPEEALLERVWVLWVMHHLAEREALVLLANRVQSVDYRAGRGRLDVVELPERESRTRD